MCFPNIQKIFGTLNNLKKDIEFTRDRYIDVFYNENAISEMKIMLAPNFNMKLVELFKSKLKKYGFMGKLQNSALDVRI